MFGRVHFGLVNLPSAPTALSSQGSGGNELEPPVCGIRSGWWDRAQFWSLIAWQLLARATLRGRPKAVLAAGRGFVWPLDTSCGRRPGEWRTSSSRRTVRTIPEWQSSGLEVGR